MTKQAKHTNKKTIPNKNSEPFFSGKNAAATKNKKIKQSTTTNKKFNNLTKQIHQIAQEKKDHKHPEQVVKNVQNAVSIDRDLQLASLNNKEQVENMDSTPVKKFNAVKYANDIIEQVKKIIPKDMDAFEADPTSSKNLQVANDNMDAALITAQNETSDALLDASNKNDFNNNSIQTPSNLELEPFGNNKHPNSVIAKPNLHSKNENDLSEDSNKIDQHLLNNNVKISTLENSNEINCINAVTDVKESQANALQTHEQYLTIAKPLANKTGDENAALITQKLNHIHQQRIDRLSAVNSKQTAEKTKEEHIRTKVAADLSAIVNKTKDSVKVKIDELSTTVKNNFQLALNVANLIFESNVRRRTDIGFFEWIANKIQGIPNDLKIIFIEEQNLFIERLRPTIETIGRLIDSTLEQTKQIVAQGRNEVALYWKQQDEETKLIAQDIYANTDQQFSTLENEIDTTNETLQNEITNQFNQAVNTLESTFERIKEENKSWLAKAYDAVVEIVDAIIEMKNLLISTLYKAVDAIDQILDDPIQFLKNIITAIKNGFINFKENILTHLKEGFIQWLVGNIPGEIEIPKTWDAKGIFTLVASILGLTWNNIKARAIKMFGPTIFHSLETAFEVFVIIKNEGIAGLWNFIKDQLNNFKDAVFSSIQNFLIEKVIKAGVTWIISLFNPASAFFKACMLIYEVISWFIKNAKRLMNLVNGIIDSIVDITAGNLKAASERVEKSLSDTIPIVIGFLAGLLGLGDLSDKVRNLMEQLRAPINKAIDWVLMKASDFVKTLLKAGKAGIEKIAGWLGLRETYRSKDGNEHTLFFEEKDGEPILMRASVKQSFVTYMNNIKKSVEDYNDTVENPKDKINLKAIEAKYQFLINNMANYNEFKKNEISKNLNALAKLLAKLPDAIAENNKIIFPPNTSKFTTKSQNVSDLESQDGASVSITSLSLRLGNLKGSPGRHTSKLFNHIYNKISETNKGNLIRGHLLNHYLGGTGDEAKNIAPIAKITNNKMERLSENKHNEKQAKMKLLSGNVFDYHVTIDYNKSEKFNAEVPSKIKMKTVDKEFNKALVPTPENLKKENNWIATDNNDQFEFNDVQKELENLI